MMAMNQKPQYQKQSDQPFLKWKVTSPIHFGIKDVHSSIRIYDKLSYLNECSGDLLN